MGDIVDTELTNIRSLRDEYHAMIGQQPSRGWNASRLAAVLECEAEWTSEGAEHLLRLVMENGWFVLRNATALAMAMGIEDGTNHL